MKILDLGCGNKKRPGAIGVDFNSRTAANVIHNLNSFPYPFEDSSFDKIYLDNTLEHLDDVMRVMEEIVEVLRGQGFRKQVVTLGHGGSYWMAPFIKSINWRFKDIIVVSSHHGGDRVWSEALSRVGLSDRNELHGGAVSRALALYLTPESVVEGEYGQEMGEHLLAYTDYATWDKLTPDGSWGRYTSADADKATAEAGQQLLEYFVEHQGRRLKELLEEACRIKGIEV